MNSFIQYREISDRNDDRFPLSIYILFSKKQTPHVPIHWHDDIEFILPQIDGYLNIDGTHYPFQNGDILFVNAKELHSTYAYESGKVVHIVCNSELFTLKCDTKYFASIGQNISKELVKFPTKIPCSHPCRAMFTDKLNQLIELNKKESLVQNLKLSSILFDILSILTEYHLLLEVPTESSTLAIDYVKQSIQYMRNHISESLSVKVLSSNAGISEGYYTRLFKQYTNQPPIIYFTKMKLELSCLFLQSGHTVTEAAQMVGMDNISYFIRLFKRQYGVTPKKFPG